MSSRKQLTAQELAHLHNNAPAMGAEPYAAAIHSPLFNQLASIDRALLNQLVEGCQYDAGAVIFEEGENGDAMYLIRSGRVAVVKGGFQAPTILGYRGPGEIVGEMALIEDAPRSASLVALEPLRLLRIRRENFQGLLNSNPAIATSIMSLLSGRLRASDNTLSTASRAGKQLAHQVTRLRTEHEKLLEIQRVRQETSDLIIHDLRNPLSVIYSAVQMLSMVLPEETLQANEDLLSIADSACKRMQRLIDSLLDVAKMEESEITLTLKPVDLKALVERAIAQQTVTARPHNIQLVAALIGEIPPVMADEEQLERVLINLLDNAVKFTPAGGLITVEVEPQATEVAISVIDSGPGIPAAERERIFERFAQVGGDQPQKRGFGLGLTFCRLAIEAHGGRIWVEPGPDDVGSRFTLTLPRKI